MNDIELAAQISPEVERFYSQGRANSHILPTHSLMCFRNLAGKLCEVLGEPHRKGVGLDLRINALRSSLAAPEIFRLELLRRHGNKGVHQEEFQDADFGQLAKEADKAAQELIKAVYRSKVGLVPSDLEIADVATEEMSRISHKAMFEKDSDAMYRAGLVLLDRAKSLNQGSGGVRPDGYLIAAGFEIDQAMFWFKNAADLGHPAAMYQIGLYQSAHKPTPIDPDWAVQEGERFLFRASELGDVDAIGAMGNLFYDGSALYEQDYEQALEFYERAAEHNHPGSLAQLGYMYHSGVGCQADVIHAATFTLRSAEAGFPQGQYNAYIVYLYGHGVEKDQEKCFYWLEKSVDEGYRPAQLALAHHVLANEIPIAEDRHPKALLESAVVVPELRSRALFGLACIRIEESTMESWATAAAEIQECYQLLLREEDVYHLKDQCIVAAKQIAKKIRIYVAVNKAKSLSSEEFRNDLMACCLFDEKGVPIADKNELVGRVQNRIKRHFEGDKTATGDLDRLLLKRAHLPKGVWGVM